MEHDPVLLIVQDLLKHDYKLEGKSAEEAISESIARHCAYLCRVCAVADNVRVTDAWTRFGICPLCQKPRGLCDVLDRGETDGTS